MFDEESSHWKIPTITAWAMVHSYHAKRGEDDELRKIPVSLPRVAICFCCST
jgi:hypothetical protein